MTVYERLRERELTDRRIVSEKSEARKVFDRIIVHGVAADGVAKADGSNVARWAEESMKLDTERYSVSTIIERSAMGRSS